MNNICPNCASKLLFDVNIGKLSCNMCGSTFDVSDVNHSEEDFSLSNNDTYDCNIYSCNQCGAEVSITNTEASTFCVYCGNPTIVFSRVARQKKPDGIIPFTIGKDEAVNLIKKRIADGKFVPAEIKNLQLDTIRGIYIPYCISSVSYSDSAIIKGTVGSGKSKHTKYFKRTGFCDFTHILSDASKNLSDESSQRLEPFRISDVKPFDEDYLTGFYADMKDVAEEDTKRIATERARTLFVDSMMSSVAASNKSIISHSPKIAVNPYHKYVLFPAWFMTFRYNNRPHTIMINGQTGKIVGAVPWNEKLLYNAVAVLTAIFSLISVPLLYALFTGLTTAKDNDFIIRLIVIIISIGIVTMISAKGKLAKIKASISRSTESSIVKYANDRQEGQ